MFQIFVYSFADGKSRMELGLFVVFGKRHLKMWT